MVVEHNQAYTRAVLAQNALKRHLAATEEGETKILALAHVLSE